MSKHINLGSYHITKHRHIFTDLSYSNLTETRNHVRDSAISSQSIEISHTGLAVVAQYVNPEQAFAHISLGIRTTNLRITGLQLLEGDRCRCPAMAVYYVSTESFPFDDA